MRGKDSGKVVDEGVLEWSVDIREGVLEWSVDIRADEAINDDDKVLGLVEVDLASCQPVIQCEAPGCDQCTTTRHSSSRTGLLST
ncbi:hypothetical protein DPMN_153213 [Dreissena polymorpha]|uniref:Uncharacterized protein n=1 Tax=Dreissena polymorpha TaxID=45954 RepID=A0A9D4FJQ8_DREPO|nr:hypothetical protein DPMN_153213 [Dreissena polymorpha]